MFSAGESPFDVCNGLKGRDLAFCRESVEKCQKPVPGADADYPYRLDTCQSGEHFVFSRVDWCVESVPKVIKDSGSCPSPSAVNKMNFQSAEDAGECDRYAKKKKEYCLEQINKCLENKDRFTSDNPILPQVCGEPYFTFTNLFFCFEGAHSLIRQYSGCPEEKKEPSKAPALSPASPPADSGPASKKKIAVLTPSNLADAMKGPMHVVVAHSLEGKEIIEELNGLRPPVEYDEVGFPINGRIAVIDLSTVDGRSVARRLNLSSPPRDQRYVKWLFEETFDVKRGLAWKKEMVDSGQKMTPLDASRLEDGEPDRFGITYVTKANFDKEFSRDKGPAIVIVGDPSDARAEEIAEKFAKLCHNPSSASIACRIVWILDSNGEGAELVKRLGAKPSEKGKIDVYYSSPKRGTWHSVSYSEPVILQERSDNDRYLGNSTENVLLIVGAGAGPGTKESAALRKYLVGEHAGGKLKLRGQNIDRIALVSNEDVPAVFGGDLGASKMIRKSLRELSSLPQAFLFSSEIEGRRPQLIPPKELPGDVEPRAIPSDSSGAGIKLANHIKALTPDNIVSVFKDRPQMDLVMVHSLDEEEVVNYLNAIDKHANLSSLDDILAPGSDPVAVINLSNPGASNAASLLGVDLESPGVKYAHLNLAGRLRPDKYFEGSRRRLMTKLFGDGELAQLYGQRPDGRGFVHVNGSNFAQQFKKDSRDAVVVVGDPSSDEAARIAKQVVDERDALGLRSRYVWIDPSGAGAMDALKQLSIHRDKDATNFGVYRVSPAGSSWEAAPYTPVEEVANDADVNRLLGTTDERVLVIIGQESGFGVGETKKLTDAVMRANRMGGLRAGGNKIDGVVVIKDFSSVYGRLVDLDLMLGRNFVEQVTKDTHRVQAYVFSEEDGERKCKPVPLNLLPGGVKPADVDVEGDVFSPPDASAQYAQMDEGIMAQLKTVESGVLMIAVGDDRLLPEQRDILLNAANHGDIDVPIYGIDISTDWFAKGAATLFHDTDGEPLKGSKVYTCQKSERDKSWTCVEY